jgi:ABC-type transport system involved in multi-copper enzyme maturation permease subunit
MITSFKAEWRKLVRRPAVWWLGAFILAMIAIVYAYSWIQYNSTTFRPGPGQTVAALKTTLYPNHFASLVVADMGTVGGALILVLGALAVGSEYTWATFKTVYAQGPGRLQVLGGQVIAVSGINAIIVVLLYGVAALSSTLIASIAGATITYPALIDIVKPMGATWLIFEAFILLGMSLSYLLRQSALAIGLGLAYMLAIEGILFQAFRTLNLDWVTTAEKFLLGQNATSLGGSFGGGAGPAAPPLVSIQQAVLVIALYGLAFLIISSVVVRARDVS